MGSAAREPREELPENDSITGGAPRPYTARPLSADTLCVQGPAHTWGSV